MTDILQLSRQYVFWLVLILCCFMIQLFQLHEALRFDRQLIESFELWRIFTGHVTHLGWSHFALNMLGLMIVALFFGSYQSSLFWLLVSVALSLVISIGLLLDGQLDRYVGFSGVLHGLFVMGAVYEYARYRLSALVVLFLLLAKLAWEQFSGPLPGSESMAGGKVAINAHLYGAIGGVLLLLLQQGLKSRLSDKA